MTMVARSRASTTGIALYRQRRQLSLGNGGETTAHPSMTRIARGIAGASSGSALPDGRLVLEGDGENRSLTRLGATILSHHGELPFCFWRPVQSRVSEHDPATSSGV